VLHADGDSIGDLLKGMDQDRHIDFSRQLAQEFAEKVGDVVKSKLGDLVFAGGDDVLALLPLDRALEGAKAVQECFNSAMSPWAARNGMARTPTISIGLAVVHITENLQGAIELSAEMEEEAKAINKDKNAFAICIRTRGGQDRRFACKWDGVNGSSAFSELLDITSEMRKTTVPRGFGFEVTEQAELLNRVGAKAWAVPAAYNHICSKKDGTAPELPGWVTEVADLKAFGQMLEIATFITRGTN
jgi:CRISPR-associated protein Cmr2